MIDCVKRWERVCQGRALPVSRPELVRIERLAEEHGKARTAWAMQVYADEETIFPNVRDFAVWVEEQQTDLPSELACTAYLTQEPSIVALATELEQLRGAWFPTVKTAEEIIVLEDKLRRVLL